MAVAAPLEVPSLPESETESWHLPVEPRTYQSEALEAWLRRGKGSIVMPTGSGKTLAAEMAMVRLKLPTVVLVPTKVLIDQWVEDLEAAGIRPGVWFGEEKRIAPVTLATYQSLFRDPGLIRHFPLLIADEGHMATADQWGALVKETAQHPYAMLLTATPPSDPLRLRLMQQYLPIVYRRGYPELIAMGYVARVEPVPYYVTMDAPDKANYDDLSRKLTAIIRTLGTNNPTEIRRLTRSLSENIRKLANAFFKNSTDRTALLTRTQGKMQALLDIAQRHPAQPILVFGSGVEQVEKACGYLAQHGIPCRVITGETRPDARREILREFGHSFYVLGSVAVLRLGYNVPEVGISVILGGGAGEANLIQRIGRTVRIYPGKAYAIVYVVMDKGTVEERIYPAVRKLFLSEHMEVLNAEPEVLGSEGPLQPPSYAWQGAPNRHIRFG